MKRKQPEIKTWRCVQGCGACCNLNPSDRPDLADYLTPEELTQYLSMVGKGGWCIHFNRDRRTCNIYENRPRFCRVQPDNFQRMYGVEIDEFNDFAIDCCQQQIEGIYGRNSQEMLGYNREIKNTTATTTTTYWG